MLGFSLGAALVRNQHAPWAIGALSAAALGALAVVLVCPERLRVVDYSQFRGGFGLASYGGPLMQGSLAMGAVLLAGGAFLVYRIRSGADR